MDHLIDLMDSKIDLLEQDDFRAFADRRQERPYQSVYSVVSTLKEHGYWLDTRSLLLSEKALSPVLISRVKSYVLMKVKDHNEHPRDVQALAIMLMLDETFGRHSGELRTAMVATINMKNAWWCWQWRASLGST